MNKNIQTVVGLLKKQKISSYEIYSEKISDLNLEIKDGKLQSQDSSTIDGFGLRLIDRGREGFGSSTNWSKSSIEETIGLILQTLDFKEPSDNTGFAKKGLKYARVKNFDNPAKISYSKKWKLLQELENSVRSFDKRIRDVNYCFYQESVTECSLVNSNGLELSHKKSDYGLTCMALADDGTDEQGFQEGSDTVSFAKLAAKKLGREVAQKALERLNGQPIKSYSGQALLTPQVMVEILQILAPSFLAESVYKKKSSLMGRVGQKIFSDKINLVDDGLVKDGLMTFPFDGEGYPRQKTRLIQKGVLTGFLYDRYWGEKFGCLSTGNSYRETTLVKPRLDTSHFYIQPGKLSHQALIKKASDLVVITEVIGMHTADEVSGDFSVGIQGLRIRGQKTSPIRQMVFSGNLFEMLSDVVAVGGNLKFYGAYGAPSLLIKKAQLSGE